jgi:hypothetical protein
MAGRGQLWMAGMKRIETWPTAVAIAGLFFVFVAAGALATYQSNNYLSVFWRIRYCDWRPPGKNFVMAECDTVISPFYRNGALYLGADKELEESLRSADVLVTGNSRTIETFAPKQIDNQIEQYFRKKQLRSFVVAQEGSGFRYRLLLLQKLGIKPKIALINSDDVFVDLLFDANREVIFNPDRFVLTFWADHAAIAWQRFICSSTDTNGFWAGWLTRAQDFYCHGYFRAIWRNAEFGTFPISYPRVPNANGGRITQLPDPQMVWMEDYWRNARTMLNSDTWRDTCIIFYMIPGKGGSGAEVLRELARRSGRPFVYPDIDASKNYFSYDGSHMDLDTSERWTAAFLPLLDPYLDACVAQANVKAGKPKSD